MRLIDVDDLILKICTECGEKCENKCHLITEINKMPSVCTNPCNLKMAQPN